jgi:hypothetical protein
MMRRLAGLACFVVALGFAASAHGAGLAPPKDAGQIVQPRVEFVVVQGGSSELLAMQTRYELKSGKPADAIACVVPLPGAASKDDAVRAAPDSLLADVRAISAEGPASSPDGKVTGAFEGKRLGSNGKQAVAALQGWLATNGFAPFADNDLRFYAGAGFDFYAARVTEKSGPLAPAGLLPPLAITFSSPRPYLPLKLLSQAGPLELRATFLTAKPLDPAQAARVGLKRDEKRPASIDATALPKSLVDLLPPSVLDELKKDKVQLLVVEGKMNADDKAARIETWLQDPSFPWRK